MGPARPTLEGCPRPGQHVEGLLRPAPRPRRGLKPAPGLTSPPVLMSCNPRPRPAPPLPPPLRQGALEHEVEMLRGLHHPNIVDYLGTSRSHSSLCIFLEFVPGGSIRQLLDRFGALDEAVARVYTRQLLLGLEYLHRNGIAHRDIKARGVAAVRSQAGAHHGAQECDGAAAWPFHSTDWRQQAARRSQLPPHLAPWRPRIPPVHASGRQRAAGPRRHDQARGLRRQPTHRRQAKWPGGHQGHAVVDGARGAARDPRPGEEVCFAAAGRWAGRPADTRDCGCCAWVWRD